MSKMAIPEDAAIAAYVVSSFMIPFPPRFPAREGADPGYFSTGVSKNHVPLYGSPLFGHHLAIWTSDGL